MKNMAILAVSLLSAGPLLAGPESAGFGLSDSTVSSRPATVTEQLLEQQRNNPASGKSEISAQLYVESQRRISDTFKAPIPESLQERANSLKEAD